MDFIFVGPALMGFKKINAVIFGFFEVTIPGWKQVLIPSLLSIPVIHFRVFNDP
jgi:hypothetical protein